MHIYFEAPELDGQLLRALSYTYYQGADIGECLATAAQIKAKDFDSWYEEWMKTAERTYLQAESSRLADCEISARQGFLRAANYYRTAMFFLYGAPVDPRLVEAYDKHCVAFAQAVALFPTPVEAMSIPYETTALPGYFYKSDISNSPRPVVIVSNGYDGTHQEGYFGAAAAALERGYHVLCFDGPGQGKMLIKQQHYMRHDWEKVITPVVDYLLTRTDVDPKGIVLLGPSWGGYLAPRAAAFEPRLAALIANPGQFDAMECVNKAFPQVNELLDHDPEHVLEKFLAQALQNPMLAAKMKAKMWIHGVDSTIELMRLWKNYNLRTVAQQISCPTLVMDTENEPLSMGQAKQLFDALTCPKEYVLFTAKEGAGEHCEAGAYSLAHQCLFDWLHKTLMLNKNAT